jgi:CRP-like cAMP-binding protein
MNIDRGHLDGIGDAELFADCTADELRQIRSLMTLLQPAEGTVLSREGSRARQFLLVGGGRAHLTHRTDDGDSKVADLESGDFLGGVELLTGTPFAATATAGAGLTIFASSLSEFQSIVQIAPSVESKIWQILERRAWETVAHEVPQRSLVRTDGVDVAA